MTTGEREITVSSDYVYRGRVVTLRVDDVRLPDGQRTKREIIEHPGAVVIVPVASDGRLLLVRQFRKAAEEWLLELPAGGLKADEDPDEAARRELAEEVGRAASCWTGLGGFYSAPGFCSEFLHLYLAEELEDFQLPGDADEEIEVVPLTMGEVLGLIASGEIRDAKTVAGVLRYHALLTGVMARP